MASKQCMLFGLLVCVCALISMGCSSNEKIEASESIDHQAKMVQEDYVVLLYQPTKVFNESGLESGRYAPSLRAHAAYMKRVNDMKAPVNIVLGGTMVNGDGAMYVFKGTLSGEVWQIASKDPMVNAGLFEATVRNWTNRISTFDHEIDEDPVYFVSYAFPGANYDTKKSVYDQKDLGKHVEHLLSGANKGDVAMAGPFSDERGGGLTMYRVANFNELKDFHDSDPWVKGGMVKGFANLWLVSMR